MKHIGHYSTEKYLSFTFEQQLKAIDKLTLTLEKAINNESERIMILTHILELCGYLHESMPTKLCMFVSELHPQLSAHQVLNKLYYYHGESLRKDSQLSIRTGDGKVATDPKAREKAARITIICDNLRSVFNIGSILRSAECLGVKEVLLCGISPSPTHPNIPKTAMGTESLVAWQHFSETREAIEYCKEKGMHIYALETVNEAVSVFEAVYSYPLALVIGNESLGIEPGSLELCDYYISLPQLGWKNSLNVGVAATAAIYQIIYGANNG